MPKYYFDKIFIEARYNNSLFFNDMSRLQTISDELINKLPNKQYDSNTRTLVLANPAIHLSVNINENRFIIDMDTPGSYEIFKNHSNEIINKITEKLAILRFGRIGMRTLRGIDKKSLQEANSFIKNNFIKFDSKIYNEIGDNLTNFGINFSFGFEKNKINLGIRSNNFQLIEILNGKVNLNQNKFQVLIDSDVYQEGILELDKIKDNFINDVIFINDNKIDEFLKNVSVY